MARKGARFRILRVKRTIESEHVQLTSIISKRSCNNLWRRKNGINLIQKGDGRNRLKVVEKEGIEGDRADNACRIDGRWDFL